MRTTLKKRVSSRIFQLRKTLHVDTQRTRKKLIIRLEEVFDLASNYARGRITRVIDDNGKERPLTIAEKQFWARIAGYTAQIINSVANGIDEWQIDSDLNKLEAMLNKTAAAGTAQTFDGQPPGKSEGT